MARIGTTYARQYPRPGDQALEAEEAERIERLTKAVGVERDRDLMAAANAAVGERVIERGGQAFDTDTPMDNALAAIKQRAAAAVADAQMTKEQKLGHALADALIERGVVPAPPTPVADDDLEEEDEPPVEAEAETEEEELYGWYDDSEDRWYKTDADGIFETDADGNYVSYEPGSFAPADDQEEYDDAA